MRSFNKYKSQYYLCILILIIIIGVNCCFAAYQTTIVEGLTSGGIQNNVLMGVGANYQLSTYTGTTWVPIVKPPGLAKPMLLAVTLGPDGKLYAAGNDFHLYVAEGDGWVKPKQPTSLQFISVATENNQLIGVGTDYKIYTYNVGEFTLRPLPGDTGPVLSVLNFNNTDFGVKTDHKLYKWITDKWTLYDPSPGPGGDGGLINICEYNGMIYGVGTDKKMYIYGGVPGKWDLAPGNDGIQLLSIYGMTHDNYMKFGFF